jgi:hypothetical protein
MDQSTLVDSIALSPADTTHTPTQAENDEELVHGLPHPKGQVQISLLTSTGLSMPLRRAEHRSKEAEVFTEAGRSRDCFVRCIIDFSDRRPHTCFQGQPRPFFCCVSPVARATTIACLPAFGRGSLVFSHPFAYIVLGVAPQTYPPKPLPSLNHI